LIIVKEEFLSSVKTKLAVRLGGWQAIAVWLALKGYVSQSNSGGFIPDDVIDDLPGIPEAWGRAMNGLLGCGKMRDDGTRGPGLVLKVEHGYRLHDHDDHGTAVEVEEFRRRKAREQKRRRREELKRLLEAGQSCGQQPDTATDGPSDTATDGDGQSEPDSHADSPRARAGTRPREHAHARAPSPTQPPPEEENPPTPKPRDRMLESLTGNAPKQRADVLALFEAWKATFGFTDAKLGVGIWNSDAETLAECIDAHGAEACDLVLKHAMGDGMVNGRDDDKRQAHDSIAYIFGNQNAFNRILRVARKAAISGALTPAEKIRLAGELR
jgi:hypothetical protein